MASIAIFLSTTKTLLILTGHFRVAVSLGFEVSVGAQLL